MAESTDSSPDSGAATGLPRLAVVLCLDINFKQNQARYNRMTKLLAEENWCKIERSSHALENTSLYKHCLLDGAAFGIHLSGRYELVNYGQNDTGLCSLN